MDDVRVARSILAVDSAGCALAAAVLGLSDPVAETLGVTGGRRRVAVVALGATSAVLASGASERVPSDRSLGTAALINVGWVALCATALTRRPGRTASAVFAITAVADGTAAAIQWSLRSGARGRPGTPLDTH